MKEKVLVVVPTTAGRLLLLKEVLEKLYSNDSLEIKTIIVKNGTYSNEEYYNFDFGLPNITKTESEKKFLYFTMFLFFSILSLS